MLLVHKRDDGYIYSYFEFDIVDETGALKTKGEYMYVRDLWVHKDYDGKKEISQYITEADKDETMSNVKQVYWLRTKWKDGKTISKRVSRSFSREVCLKHKEK